jgi:AraC family transcriptional regulator
MTKLALSGELKICGRCGGSFTCDAASGKCWCFDLPKVMPIPGEAPSGCLCPACLREAIKSQTAKNPMTEQIADLPAATYAYLRHIGPYGPAITPFWQKIVNWAKPRGLLGETTIWFGISHDNPMTTPPEQCRYDACVEIPTDFNIDGIASRGAMPGGPYLLVPFHGNATEIGKAFESAMDESLPRVERQFDPTRPIFERYRGSMNTSLGAFTCDICVPIR